MQYPDRNVNGKEFAMFGFHNNIEKGDHVIFPKEFRKIDRKIPEDLGFPENTLWLGMRTERTAAMLFCCPATREASMPFDDNDRIIREMHRDMRENEGLIEVKIYGTQWWNEILYNTLCNS